MKASTRKEIFSLPDNERRKLAQELLNSIAKPVDDEDFSPEDMALIDERIKHADDHPDQVITLEQFRKRFNIKPRAGRHRETRRH